MEHTSSWVEIKAAVLPAEADAVANFLIELGSNGIVEESNNLSSAGPRNEGFLILKAYLHNDVNLFNSIDSLKMYLMSLQSMDPGSTIQRPELLVTEIEDEDWNEKWKSFFRPIKVTKNIVIKPSWRNYWKKNDEIVIELAPGMAFGTGTHPSTRLCLQALEDLIGDYPDTENASLLDVGTGSGILAIAAALLGIKQVVGIDIDVQAVECAKKNAAVNAVAEQVLLASSPLYKLPGSFSIVVANILPKTLIDMKDDLIRHLEPTGYLILSGILQEKAREVIDAFKKELVFKKETREEEWSCLIFKNKAY